MPELEVPELEVPELEGDVPPSPEGEPASEGVDPVDPQAAATAATLQTTRSAPALAPAPTQAADGIIRP